MTKFGYVKVGQYLKYKGMMCLKLNEGYVYCYERTNFFGINANEEVELVSKCENCRFGVEQAKGKNVLLCTLTGAFINGDNDLSKENYSCAEFEKKEGDL